MDAINDADGLKPVTVSKETYCCIKEGVKYSKLSSRKYDITVGPLVKSWGIGTDNTRLPSTAEINSDKALINYKYVVLDDTNMTVMLKNKGMLIDLGGIAKGFIADEVGNVLTLNNSINRNL